MADYKNDGEEVVEIKELNDSEFEEEQGDFVAQVV